MNITNSNPKRITKDNVESYIKMLFEGLYSSIKNKNFYSGIKITYSLSECMNLFKIRDKDCHYELIHRILIIKL
jgi:hypothetical protein